MSELKKKINETALKELMVSIRRNAKDSACITNFENLLHEIDDPEFVNITVNSMTNFMSEWFELLGAAVIVPQKKFRSKMLTSQFIEPLRFFGRVKKILNKFRREVAKDKKSNPFWEKYKSRNIFDDEEDYYCVWDFEGHRTMNQTVIVVKCNNLIEKQEKRSKDEGELCPCCHESVLGLDGECSYCGYGRK